MPPVALQDRYGNPLVDKKGNDVTISPSLWLDDNRAVAQMTWAPGFPQLIADQLVDNGGWMEAKGKCCFNLYRPPEPVSAKGDASKAGPWIDNIRLVYPNDADHIIKWFAHRVQKPGEKINHALVLGGGQGIGKDTLLAPIVQAIGEWNVGEANPKQIMDRFNAFVKSVILRVSEARDLGEADRFQFYEHMKTYIAAPPETLPVDEKNIRVYRVLNVCGVIITTNYKTNGLYLPPDDRRHYVSWSEKTMKDSSKEYWNKIWHWYEKEDGFAHVGAYLSQLDISDFNAKAPPPHTDAWKAIVFSDKSTDSNELADLLDRMGRPNAVTTGAVQDGATVWAMQASHPTSAASFAAWINDRKSRRAIAHRMRDCGYEQVPNDNAEDNMWRVDKRRQMVWGKAELSEAERLTAAREL